VRITLLGVLVVLGAGALLWFVLLQIEQHRSQSQQVEPDQQVNPNENLGPNENRTL
jgi:hypothetical protein